MTEFEDAYRAHVQAVFRFAMRCVSNRSLAEDLTAEAFLELYKRQREVDFSRLPGWLLTVVRNRARDHWRRQQVEARYAAERRDAEAADPPPVSETWLLECPDLKPVHRACLMLRYSEGLTRAEIASATGLSEMQVKGHLQYGLELLRRSYAKGEMV